MLGILLEKAKIAIRPNTKQLFQHLSTVAIGVHRGHNFHGIHFLSGLGLVNLNK